MSKDFQEATLTVASGPVALVGNPGVVSISSPDFDLTFGVKMSMTGDETAPPLGLSVFANQAQFIRGSRLTFSLIGAPVDPTVTIRWFEVREPY